MLILIGCHGLVIVAGDADVKDTTSEAYANATRVNVVTSELSAPLGRYHFFVIAFCRMSDFRHTSS